MDKLSVCMVLFNRWEMSKITLQSIAMTVPKDLPIEWCLIDNGSKDETSKNIGPLLAELGGHIGYLEILDEKIPATQATNRSINAATGKWMLRIDNDIEMSEGWFQDCYAIMNDPKLKDVGFVCPTHHIRERDSLYKPNLVYGEDNDTYIDMVSNSNMNVPGNIFTRTAIVRDIGGFYTPYNLLHADVHYCMVAKHIGYKWGYTWKTLCKHIGVPKMEEEYSQMAVHERRSEDQRHQNLLNGRTRPEDIQPQELEFAQQITMMLKKPGKKLQFHKNVNVLIPSCGRRVELVKLFKKVFEIPRWEGKIFTCGCDWAMPAAYYSDKHFIVPEIYDPKYIDSIIKICDENEITYIFPVIDYDVKVLSHNKLNILRSVGTEVVCLESHYADICNDKFLTHQFFEKNGLSSPKTYQGVIPYASQITKFIMKPKFGFGSKNMKMIESTNRINDVPIEEGYVVQEFVEGVEYTCDIVSDRRYEIVSLVARKREAVRGGEIQQGEIVNHLGFYSQFSIVSKQLELIGPWCIQYIIDSNNQVHFIEINPRFGGGVPITARAGQNHALISLKVLQRDYSGYHNRYLVEWGLTALRFDDCTYKHIPEKKNHDSNGSIRLKG